MSNPKSSSTLREIQEIFIESTSNGRFWAIMLGIIALFVVVGPFGTFDSMPFAARAIYWPSTMLGSWLIAVFVIAVVVAVVKTPSLPMITKMMIAAILASLPIGTWNWLAARGFFPGLAGNFDLLRMILFSLPMTVIFSLISYYVLRDQFDEPEIETISTRPNLLMERLSFKTRGPVISMSMQDHYIEVTTTKGAELILMRMADAVSELSDTKGVQVHRSHWVNPEFVTDSIRENGQHFIVMKTGAKFPVSRSYVDAAKQAGLI